VPGESSGSSKTSSDPSATSSFSFLAKGSGGSVGACESTGSYYASIDDHGYAIVLQGTKTLLIGNDFRYLSSFGCWFCFVCFVWLVFFFCFFFVFFCFFFFRRLFVSRDAFAPQVLLLIASASVFTPRVPFAVHAGGDYPGHVWRLCRSRGGRKVL
jgi:hypothetical protein